MKEVKKPIKGQMSIYDLTLEAQIDMSMGWKSLKQKPSFFDGRSISSHVLSMMVPIQWLLCKAEYEGPSDDIQKMAVQIQLVGGLYSVLDIISTYLGQDHREGHKRALQLRAK